MWSNKVHRILNPQRVCGPPETFGVCGGRSQAPSPVAPHWVGAMALTVPGTTRRSVWLKIAKCLHSICQKWGTMPRLDSPEVF